MANYQKDKKEVQDFLEKVKDIIVQHKKGSAQRRTVERKQS